MLILCLIVHANDITGYFTYIKFIIKLRPQIRYMANSKQAIKRARQNADRYKLKHSQRSQARTAVKAVRNAIAENNKESASVLLETAQKVLDSAASKKVIHKNAAARTKSRLVKAVKAIS